MAMLRSEHCGDESSHDGHRGTMRVGLDSGEVYCDGDPATLARQRERAANPPPGPPAPPVSLSW